MSSPRPLLRYHGGKWRLAPWIIRHLPAHQVYVEPFGGAASVLIRKPRSYAEVYNDLDGEIVHLFRTVRDRGDELATLLELTPYASAEFSQSFEPAVDELERARRTVVRSFMGFGGNLTRPNRDQSPQRTGFRRWARQSGSHPCQDWRNYPASLVQIIERLQGVVIEQRHALELVPMYDSPEALFYVDPPYVHSTRAADAGGSHRGYRHEMTDDEHRELAQVLHAARAQVVLSGYASDLYSQLYADWHRVEKSAHADGGRDRVEVLWINAPAFAGLSQQSLI